MEEKEDLPYVSNCIISLEDLTKNPSYFSKMFRRKIIADEEDEDRKFIINNL